MRENTTEVAEHKTLAKFANASATSGSVVDEFIDRELIHPAAGRRHHGEHGPLPIIVSNTGHRDLRPDDVPHLQDALRNEYRQFRAEFPSTSVILLSAIADGADRLCARLAIEGGLRLIVVLPMPQDLYETDFDEESKKEFRELISLAEHSFELPIVEGYTRDDIVEHGFPREQQYAQAGAFLATHSAVLIALWDGVHLQKIGGTSHVIRFKLEGVPEPFAPPHSELDAPDSGPVYHIVTPRISNPNPDAKPFDLLKMYPEGYESHEDAEKAFHELYERIDAFNKDALKHAEELKEHRRKSKEYIFPAKAQQKMPRQLREILEFYAIADVLAQRFQKRTLATIQLLLTFVFFAALFFEMYSGIFSEPVMMGLYLSTFILSFVTYYWAARKGYQTKYLDYRALAEGLRVQFFWKLAGLKDSVADYYMRKQKSELDWIRNAVRSCMTETCPDEDEGNSPLHQRTPDAARITQVLKHWVEDQAKYFAKAARRDHEKLHSSERKIVILFGTALLLALTQMVIGEHNHFLLLGIGVLPVIAALLHSYLQKNALAEHKRQYDRMSGFYHRAKVHLEKLIAENRLHEAQSFIGELGREALAENGDWILTHRDRPLEVPKGA